MHDRIFGSVAVVCVVAMAALGLASSGFGGSARASADDLQVGQTVAIEGKAAGARTVHASEIEIQEESGEAKLKGRIQNVDGGAHSLVSLRLT